MKKEKIEKSIEDLFNIQSQQVKRFFEQNPIKQMVQAHEALFSPDDNSPLATAFKKVIESLAEQCDSKSESERSEYFEEFKTRFFLEAKLFFNQKMTNILYFCLLQSLFCPKYNFTAHFQSEVREQLRTEFGLKTRGELQNAFLEIFKKSFLDHITNIGEGFWTKKKRSLLLAAYNRFYIVIKNVRSDFDDLKKKKTKDSDAWKEIGEKYEIPERLRNSNTLMGKPSAAALDWVYDWAYHELGLEKQASDYLEKILQKARDENDSDLVAVVFYSDGVGESLSVKRDNKLAKTLKYTQPELRQMRDFYNRVNRENSEDT